MAFIASGASAPDPYEIHVLGNVNSKPYLNTSGRTLVHPSLVPGETTGVFITAGQSNGAGANYVNAAYAPTHAAKNQTLNIFDGGVYQTVDPLLGGGGLVAGSWGSQLADKLIDGGVFSRVVLVPTDVGGTQISEWAPGAQFFERFIVATKRAIAAGLPVSGYIWCQGEGDHAAGTSQAAYAAALTSIITRVRSYGAGFQAPWFIGLCTYVGGSTSSAVRAAQASVVNGSDIYSGADMDTVTGATNRVSELHLTAAGAEAVANLWKVALDGVF